MFRVVFSGSPEGEFWYQLVLSAEDPQPISLPTIQCELGRYLIPPHALALTHFYYRTELQTITLSNPLDEPALFSCDNSNTRHFIVTGLPPEGQVHIFLYNPIPYLAYVCRWLWILTPQLMCLSSSTPLPSVLVTIQLTWPSLANK